MGKDKYKFSSFFTEGQYQTQVETLEVMQSGEGATIGIPKEDHINESRVALVPNSIRSIIGYGHRVVVQSKAGEKAHYSDGHYTSAGAEVTKDINQVYQSDIILRCAPPTLAEIDLMKIGQVLVSPLPYPMITAEYLNKIKEKKIIAIAMEQLKNRDGSFPITRMMSEMAGRIAILTAAELLASREGGRGVLLGGVSGVPPSKVVILGAGVVGEYATRTALGLGASVRIFDNDINKIIRLQNKVGRQLHTSSINPEYVAYQLTSADVVISAMHSKKGLAPILVTKEMVSNMKKGAVIVDVSIDQGGCIETSKMTSHQNPTFSHFDVLHYCVPNIASKVPRTSSSAISNILTPLLLELASQSSLSTLLHQNDGLRNGVYSYEGHITKEYLSKRFGMKYTALELILTSRHS